MTTQSVEHLLQLHEKGKISDFALDEALSSLNTSDEKSFKNEERSNEHMRKREEKFTEHMRRMEKEFEERMDEGKIMQQTNGKEGETIKKRKIETTNIGQAKKKKVEQQNLKYRNTLFLTVKPLCNYFKTFTIFVDDYNDPSLMFTDKKNQ